MDRRKEASDRPQLVPLVDAVRANLAGRKPQGDFSGRGLLQ